jgi:ubiquinone/menaquinone biosynthesis C-methylase UbiE
MKGMVASDASERRRGGSWVKGLLALNRRLSEGITPLHYAETHGIVRFHDLCLQQMCRKDVHDVLDVGAGKAWHFPRHLKDRLGLRLTGVDISGEEIRENDMLDQKVVSDVVEALPFPAESFDLITVRWGIEHFADNDAFLAHCQRCLRRQGAFVAVFPSKFAPFAILNRILPSRIARTLLLQLRPESQGGFKAYYDRTTYAAFSKALEKNGFVVTYYYPTFFSSGYFKSIFPLYVLSLGYDLFRFVIGVRSLASFHLFVAEKQ